MSEDGPASGVTHTVNPKTNETVITVPVSLAVSEAVILDLRPHHKWLDEETEQREKVDILVGDPELDRRYHIEAAPSDLIREAFDEPVRAFLVAAESCRLALLGTELKLTRENLPAPLVETALAILPRFAESLDTLVKAAAIVPVSVDGSPYRGGEPSKAVARRRQRADLEVKRLRWLQKTPALNVCLSLSALATTAGIVFTFWQYPFILGVVAILLAIPAWSIGGFVLYLVTSALGSVTGINALYHRIGNRKYDELEAKLDDPGP